MAHVNTILHQLQQLMPLHSFDSFVGQHKADKYTKKLTCRNQLSILLYAQATGKDSLRDIETGLSVEHKSWYHLGLETVARSTLARANQKRPYQIYESLFYQLVEQCQTFSSGTAKQFSFTNPIKAIDASTIELCLSLFPWATFRKEKGALKIHVEYDVRDQIPELVLLTDGKVADITAIRDIDLSKYAKGTIFVFDRGYNDYTFLKRIKDAGHHFVIRRKKDAHLIHLGQHRSATGNGVLKDEKVAFALPESQEKYPHDLRLVTFHDVEHDVLYEFLTDEFRLSAANIALIYKRRWDIELFFKWIKQHLKIKTFLGTSKNAVLTQIWVAMIYYLLLYWVKFQFKFKGSLLKLTRLLRTGFLKNVSLVNIINLKPEKLSLALKRASPEQLLLL
jgi:hypothetical protein